MRLKSHSGAEIDCPDAAAIELAFARLSEPSDFLVLNDPAQGEVRVAGPHYNTFLLQWDFPALHRKPHGEFDNLQPADAIEIFKAFRNGDTTWTERDVSRDSLPREAFRRLILGLTLTLAILLAAYLVSTWSN